MNFNYKFLWHWKLLQCSYCTFKVARNIGSCAGYQSTDFSLLCVNKKTLVYKVTVKSIQTEYDCWQLSQQGMLCLLSVYCLMYNILSRKILFQILISTLKTHIDLVLLIRRFSLAQLHHTRLRPTIRWARLIYAVYKLATHV